MADPRSIHVRCLRSAKVAMLTDLEFRVWMTYELAADDCGVMPCTAARLQDANHAFEGRPARLLVKALQRLIGVTLVPQFDHQGRSWICQHDWQDYQKIRFPRESNFPVPPEPIWSALTEATRGLFLLRLRRHAESARSEPRDNSTVSAHPTGAPDRAEPLTTNSELQTLNSEGEKSARETPPRIAPPGTRPPALLDGAAMRRHGTHAWCSLPERDGLCVPRFLHQEFIGKLGRTTAHAELLTWYPMALALFAGRSIGEDALVFWRNSFAVWVGVATSKPVHRPPAPGSAVSLGNAGYYARELADIRAGKAES